MTSDPTPVPAGALEDLEALRTQYAAIVEWSDDAVISKDLQGIIRSWNPGAEKLFGYRAEEVLGRSMLMLFPPDRQGEEAGILARIARGDRVDHFETVRVRKDGSPVDVSVTISPIKNANGEIVGASKIARDITDRKQAERKLQMQLTRLALLGQITRAIGQRQDLASILQVTVRSIEESLPLDFSCVLLYDPANETLTVRSVGTRSAALSLELGMPDRQRIAIDQNGLSHCVRGQLVYEPDIGSVPFPFPERLARGGLRAMVAAPLLVESKVFGVLIAARRQPHSFSSGECEFLRQLSEHVGLASHQAETHAALQAAYEDLRQTQGAVLQQERLRALGQMASGIAHDINNAISPVAIYVESLLEREPNLSERGREYLTIIQRAIEDVAETVGRMREFYRPRELEQALTEVSLNRLVGHVLDLTRARWNDQPQQRGVMIRLQTELAADLPAIRGTENEIRDALTNLIFNAVDAMPEGGTLAVRTQEWTKPSAGARHVRLEVRDSGVGMDEDTRSRCLEPFFSTKGERGSGLGLAMVYGMTQRHGAELQIDSSPGQGTCFALMFPALTPAAASSTGSTAEARAVQPVRILVIDDDPVLLRSLTDVLEGDGHGVTAVDGGQAGIDAFMKAHESAEPFAVVITDLGMPYVDGRRVAAAIKTASPATPVILLTGWGRRMEAENDKPDHIDRLLSKPPKLIELRAALAALTAAPEADRV